MEFKDFLKIKRHILFAKFLMTLNFGFAHEAETIQPFEKIHTHKSFEAHVHAGWESRYFSEGRDALDGKSLWVGSVEFGYDHFSAGVWYGRSSNHSYDELQYSLALTQEVENLQVYFGYTHLVFSIDDESDDEWSAGISYGELPFNLDSSLDASYSMDAAGTFIEWSNSWEFILNEELGFSLSSVLGWNDGYVSDGHDGLNYHALRMGTKKTISQNVSLVGHGAYSWAIDKDENLPGDQQLGDFFHLGLGLEWGF